MNQNYVYQVSFSLHYFTLSWKTHIMSLQVISVHEPTVAQTGVYIVNNVHWSCGEPRITRVLSWGTPQVTIRTETQNPMPLIYL